MTRSLTRQVVATATLALTAINASAQAPTAPTTESPQSATPPVAPPAAVPPGVATTTSPSFDRITFSSSGSSLTNSNGGATASAGWIHNFDPDTLLSAAAEYDALSVSHWTFGSIAGAITRGPGDQRYTFYGEAHEGAGDDGAKAFKYRIEGLGVTGTYYHRLSATLEDKQVNVETTHGNLPKVGLSYLWNPHVQTAISYQYSFGGNLGTRLTSGRVDLYGSVVNFLGGFAVGQAAPALLGATLTLPSHDLKEGYVGLAKPLPQWRSDVTLILDYQHLSGGTAVVGDKVSVLGASQRWTGTLNYVYHLNGL